MGIFSFFSKDKKDTLDKGLTKTKEGFLSKLTRAVAGKSKIDDSILDELEEVFITSDVGVETTLKIIDRIEKRVARDKYINSSELNELLCDEIGEMLIEGDNECSDDFKVDASKTPYVIMVVGVNGVGKTTTVGKLAGKLKNQNRKVLLAAADTFRAAAVEQLEEWSHRAGVDIITGAEGSDPASVIFDAVNAAKARNVDVLLCDTAGRLHNKKNLMEELKKINRIIDREFPGVHRENLIVLDASTGQNALNQAREFSQAADITGIVLTKMDGTAKGGIAIAISSELSVPVKYIGVGETIDDLQKFDSDQFVNALFDVKGDEEAQDE